MGKGGGEDLEEKCNKLSGCNHVLPPDKRVANPDTLSAALAMTPPLGCGPSWQRWAVSLRATGWPARGHEELDDVKLCLCVSVS